MAGRLACPGVGSSHDILTIKRIRMLPKTPGTPDTSGGHAFRCGVSRPTTKGPPTSTPGAVRQLTRHVPGLVSLINRLGTSGLGHAISGIQGVKFCHPVEILRLYSKKISRRKTWALGPDKKLRHIPKYLPDSINTLSQRRPSS